VPESTVFRGGEGLFYHDGVMFLATKGDDRVWAYDIASATMSVLYDNATDANPILSGVDNLVGTCCGDLLVAEDGGDMQIVAILPDGTLKPMMQIVNHDASEVTGPAFDPSGTRLYFSSQRGENGATGVTYEISGPFHSAE
jgi:secreted PhoX family phosphatase